MSRVFKSTLAVADPLNARTAYEIVPHAPWATRAYNNAVVPRLDEQPWADLVDLSPYFISTDSAPNFNGQKLRMLHGPLFYQYPAVPASGIATAYSQRISTDGYDYGLSSPAGKAPLIKQDGGYRTWNFTETSGGTGSNLYSLIARSGIEADNVITMFCVVEFDLDSNQTLYHLGRNTNLPAVTSMEIAVASGNIVQRGRRGTSSESLATATGPAVPEGRTFVLIECEYSSGAMRLFVDDMETAAGTGTLNSTGTANLAGAHLAIGNNTGLTSQAQAQIGACGMATKIWTQEFKDEVRDWALGL